MRSFTIPLVCLASALFFGPAGAVAQESFDTPWPMLPRGETAEEGQRWGRLENGLRYVIVPSSPEHQTASVRLVVAAGLAHEQEASRGVARVIEDLAMRGTSNFSRNELAQFFMENGMNPLDRGRVETELDFTVYRFDLERGPAGALAKAFDLCVDIAGGLRIDEENVADSKRLLVEKAQPPLLLPVPDGARRHAALYPKSPYVGPEAARLSAQLEKLSAADVQGFWDRWYRPERLTLIVTGAVDSAEAETALRQKFAGLAARGEKPKDPARPSRMRPEGDLEVEMAKELFASVTVSHLSKPLDLYDPKDEERYRRLDFAGRYARSLMTEVDQLGGDSVAMERGAALVSLNGRFPVLQLQERLVAMDRVTHRLAQFGIREQDLPKLKKSYKGLVDSYDVEWSSRETASLLAERLVRCLTERMPFRKGEALVASLEKSLAAFTTEVAAQVCGEVFPLKSLRYLVVLPEGFGLSAKAIDKRLKSMRKGYDFTWERAGEVAQDLNVRSGFEPNGLVTSTNRLGIGPNEVYQYVFKNNLRLNVLQTKNYPGQYWMRLSLGNGLTTYPTPYAGLDSLTRSLLPKTKIGQGVQAPTLRKALEGKGMTFVDGGANMDQVYWSARGEDEGDLHEFLSSLVVWMVSSEVKKESFDEDIESMKAAGDVSSGAAAFRKIDEELFSEDPRLRQVFVAADLEDASFAEFTDWLRKVRQEGYLELTVVGDVSPRSVLRDVRKTFGSAPERVGKVIQPRHGKPAVHREPGVVRVEYGRANSDAQVAYYWPLPMERSCESDFRVEVMKDLLEEYVSRVVRDRSETFGSYSIDRIGVNMIPGSYGIRLELRCRADKAAEGEAFLEDIASGFTSFLTPELVLAAQRAEWIGLTRMNQSDTLLLSAFDQSQGKPYSLKCMLDQFGTGVSYPFDSFVALAAKMFAAENARGVVLSPKSK